MEKTTKNRKYVALSEGRTLLAVRHPFDGFEVKVLLSETTTVVTHDKVLGYEYFSNNRKATEWLRRSGYREY